MKLDDNDGYNIVYAKIGGVSKFKYFKERRKVVEFLMDELNNIDFMSINDVIINRNELVNSNLKLSRYLKLIKINEI